MTEVVLRRRKECLFCGATSHDALREELVLAWERLQETRVWAKAMLDDAEGVVMDIEWRLTGRTRPH